MMPCKGVEKNAWRYPVNTEYRHAFPPQGASIVRETLTCASSPARILQRSRRPIEPGFAARSDERARR
jgi:hypothetical protein